MIQKNTLTLAQQLQEQPETQQKTQQSRSLPYAQRQDIKNKNRHKNAKCPNSKIKACQTVRTLRYRELWLISRSAFSQARFQRQTCLTGKLSQIQN